MPQAQQAPKGADGRRNLMSNGDAWPTERWAAVVVLGSLGALILLRMGFRGVGLMGARVSVN